MQYLVVGADGSEYGPADLNTMKQWVADNRIAPHSQLKEFETGRTLLASALPGLFGTPPPVQAPANWAVPPSPYPRGMAMTQNSGNPGMGAFWGSVIRSAVAVLLFFWLHGIGLIIGGYALYYAIQCKQHGNKYGNLAIGIAGVAVVAILIGWGFRLSGGSR